MMSFLKVHTDYDTDPFLNVFTDSDTVRFRCSGLDKNEIEFADLFDDFLLNLSKGKNTFIYTYRLSDISKLVDESTIISRADILLDPFQTFFRQLSESGWQIHHCKNHKGHLRRNCRGDRI